MGAQQNFEWHFYDEDGSDDQSWADMQAVTPNAEMAPDWQWGKLRKLWVILPFIALLLWARSWQSSEAVSQPKQMPTSQPMSRWSETPIAHSVQHGGSNLSEVLADRQAVAEYQANLAFGYVETSDYTATQANNKLGENRIEYTIQFDSPLICCHGE